MSVRRAGRLCVVLAVGCGGTDRRSPAASRPACTSTASSGAAASSYNDSSDSWTSIDSMNTQIGHVDVRPAFQSIERGLDVCRRRNVTRGIVRVRITVAPAGCVGSVTVVSTPEPSLGACVVEVVRTAMFPATDLGGTLSYTFEPGPTHARSSVGS